MVVTSRGIMTLCSDSISKHLGHKQVSVALTSRPGPQNNILYMYVYCMIYLQVDIYGSDISRIVHADDHQNLMSNLNLRESEANSPGNCKSQQSAKL